MEKVYPPKIKTKVKIGDFKKEFSEALKIESVEKRPEGWNELPKVMGLEQDLEAFEELEASISLDQISTEKDIPVEPFDPTKSFYNRYVGVSVEVPTDALQLETVRDRIETCQNSNWRIHERKSRHFRNQTLVAGAVDKSKEDLVPFEETLISLRFYQPFKYDPENVNFNISFCQEYWVLGSQKISALRDKIFCSANDGPFPECSENPHAEPPPLQDDSAFFFITDTFYNDLSRPDAKDYSSPIMEWAKTVEDIGELKAASMDDVTFDDLTVRLGYPQVYQHYGNCEHIFVFSDIRLLHPSDTLVRSNYPFLKTISNNRCHICFICGVNQVKFIVRESKRQIADPTFYCQTCFDTYHYKDGQKIGEFKAYRFAESRPYVP